MAAAVGKALKGLGKAFLKRRATIGGLKAASRRGTPTKAGLVARRAALRGETTAEKYKGFKQPPTPKGVQVKAPKKPGFKTGVALGAASALAAKSINDSAYKKAKAEDKKLKKEIEKHEKKTKEKRKKYGKHHG